MGKYWLMKCEPDECSFDELKTRPKKRGYWRGVRNYQVRNFIRDDMSKGDLGFFYHSNCKVPGVAGLVEVVRAGYPDPSQFDPDHKYFDPDSAQDNPRWYSMDVKWKKALKNFVSLKDLKANSKLKDMRVVQKFSRLSVQPVTKKEFDIVCKMAGIG